MATLLNPYLSFAHQAREAMNFYHGVFGGELVTSTFAEAGQAPSETEGELIMHAQLTTAAGHTVMASDRPAAFGPVPQGQQVSLSGDDEATLTRWWEALSDGAQIQQPLTAAPWGDSFGMLLDRYGIVWMVNIAGTAS